MNLRGVGNYYMEAPLLAYMNAIPDPGILTKLRLWVSTSSYTGFS